MSDGRTYWLMLDAAWFDRALVAELAATHKGTGVAAVLWLYCHAKAQNDDGRVKSGWASVARGIGSSRSEVESALLEAASLGLLDDFEVLDDGRRFTCRISGWEADQTRGAAAGRKSQQRDRERDMSRGEERRGQERKGSPSPSRAPSRGAREAKA